MLISLSQAYANIPLLLPNHVIHVPCSAKWQERNAALEEVENILKAAGGRIQPSVNKLVALLRVSCDELGSVRFSS